MWWESQYFKISKITLVANMHVFCLCPLTHIHFHMSIDWNPPLSLYSVSNDSSNSNCQGQEYWTFCESKWLPNVDFLSGRVFLRVLLRTPEQVETLSPQHGDMKEQLNLRLLTSNPTAASLFFHAKVTPPGLLLQYTEWAFMSFVHSICLEHLVQRYLSSTWPMGIGGGCPAGKELICSSGLCIFCWEKNPLLLLRLIFYLVSMANKSLGMTPLTTYVWNRKAVLLIASWVPTILWNSHKLQYTAGFKNDVFKDFKDVTNKGIMYTFIQTPYHADVCSGPKRHVGKQ